MPHYGQFRYQTEEEADKWSAEHGDKFERNFAKSRW